MEEINRFYNKNLRIRVIIRLIHIESEAHAITITVLFNHLNSYHKGGYFGYCVGKCPLVTPVIASVIPPDDLLSEKTMSLITLLETRVETLADISGPQVTHFDQK